MAQDELSFTSDGVNYDLTLTFAGSATTGTVEAVSGTIAGAIDIVGVSNFNGADNQISATPPYVDGPPPSVGGPPPYGYGLSFDTADYSYNLYSVEDADFLMISADVGAYAVSDINLVQNVACFLAGARIATPGGEVAVEDLAIGDLVVTASGQKKPIRWIGRRCYSGWLAAGNPNVMPICFKAGSLADHVPMRDLWVSPEHAMFLEGSLVPAWLLVNGVSILKAEALAEVHYFHIELERHDVIIAEGALSETFVDDDSRGLFHNAPEYYAAHPESFRVPAMYCAPRLEDGFELEILREKLVARAARLQADGSARRVEIQGRLDFADRNRIAGWARDLLAPERRAPIVVLCDGAVVARGAAGRHRADLERAGIGDGRHAFEFDLGYGLTPEWRHVIEIRSAEDWSLLPGSPVVIEADVMGAAEFRAA